MFLHCFPLYHDLTRGKQNELCFRVDDWVWAECVTPLYRCRTPSEIDPQGVKQ